jgi:hypothetical protein
VNEYWRRATFGLIEMNIVFFPWRTLPGDQATLDKSGKDGGRSFVAGMVRAQAATDGVRLDQFDRVIALVHPPPGDRGAVRTGGDVVLDEIGPGSDTPMDWLEYFEHETGHLLGFDHAFGPSVNPKPYQDNFCVMGNTGSYRHPILPQPSLAEVADTIGPGNIWFSGRRLAAANLYRSVPAFAQTPGVTRMKRGTVQRVHLIALSQASLGDPVLAVVTTGNGEVTVEYRAKTGDDAGLDVAPCLVLHSIGRRTPAKDSMGRSPSEVNPIVLEGSCAASIGSVFATTEGDVVVSVIDVAAAGHSVTVQVICN